MKYFSLFASLFFSISIIAQNCDSTYFSSLKAFDEEKYDSAIVLINHCIDSCKADEKYHLHAAKIYFEKKNYALTIKNLNKAIEINDSCVEAHAFKAHIYLEENDYNAAITNYKKVFAILPHTDFFDVVYHVNLSKAYMQTNQFQKAYDILKIAYPVDSTSLEMNSNLAVCCMNLDKESEAEFYLNRCLQISPNFTGGLVNMGFYLTSKNKLDKAIEYYNKALALLPREAFALNNRGYTYYLQERYDLALEDINNSIKIEPSNSYAYKNRGLVYAKTGLTEDACKDFEKALQLGFTEMYGNEVQILKNEICGK